MSQQLRERSRTTSPLFRGINERRLRTILIKMSIANIFKPFKNTDTLTPYICFVIFVDNVIFPRYGNFFQERKNVKPRGNSAI